MKDQAYSFIGAIKPVIQERLAIAVLNGVTGWSCDPKNPNQLIGDLPVDNDRKDHIISALEVFGVQEGYNAAEDSTKKEPIYQISAVNDTRFSDNQGGLKFFANKSLATAVVLNKAAFEHLIDKGLKGHPVVDALASSIKAQQTCI